MNDSKKGSNGAAAGSRSGNLHTPPRRGDGMNTSEEPMNPACHVLYYKYKHTYYSPPSSFSSFLLSAQALSSFLSLLFPLPHLRDLSGGPQSARPAPIWLHLWPIGGSCLLLPPLAPIITHYRPRMSSPIIALKCPHYCPRLSRLLSDCLPWPVLGLLHLHASLSDQNKNQQQT